MISDLGKAHPGSTGVFECCKLWPSKNTSVGNIALYVLQCHFQIYSNLTFFYLRYPTFECFHESTASCCSAGFRSNVPYKKS